MSNLPTELITQAAPDPEAAQRLLKALEREDEPIAAWKELAAEVDESAYGLAEWLEAIDLFLQHGAETGRQFEFSRAVGYVACTGESQAGSPTKLPLPDLTAEMLEQYGIED